MTEGGYAYASLWAAPRAGDVGIVRHELGVLVIQVPLLLQYIDQPVKSAMAKAEAFLYRIVDNVMTP